MAEKRKSRRGWALVAAALGAGAGLAIERYLVGRDRLLPDPFAGVDYGGLLGDRRYEVSASDGAVLLAEEFGPQEATSGAIFLHGYCLDRTIWHHQLEGVPDGLRFIAYDARHHGLSHDGSEEIDVKALAADLMAVIDRSELEQIVLIGHSMGGMTALEFCRQYEGLLGDRVKGIVLVNTTYTDAVKTMFAAELIGPIERRLRRAIQRVIDDPRSSRVMRLRGDDFSWLLVRLTGFGKGASPAQVAHTRKLLASFPSPALIGVMRALRDFDMEDALEAIDIPALIIAGGNDRITTVRASEHMHERIATSSLRVFHDAGHMSMMERASEFNQVVLLFIEDALEK